ncbi:EAL domain-containing protein [Tindallia californiensis]|uniref:EAL domain, c-di-GMP-specific phosphodiesterase class I (Or its enzymatically inactive variant) n=1 Tax=Tindallia californiensis TaxID=159292 RepID=A0A1H3MD98_9FIRM|nr:EAL domain-containing protein [Tindallia californiensis]SDY73995.1 EAL domain, c-di-GMP-specific phosphodiesterase class I (or its enzymatically inactive variant) [Tindallia californiensis]
MECKRCTVIPETSVEASWVYIKLPTHHHIAPLEKIASGMKETLEPKANGFLLKISDFQEFVLRLCRHYFNSIEQMDIYLMPMKEAVISFESLDCYKRLSYWKNLFLGEDLIYILKEKSLKILFHPIVLAKDHKIYGYEALTRGIKRDGRIMSPIEMFRYAKEMDLLFHLDRLCREQVIKQAAEAGILEKVFINFIPTSIYDPDKCLRSTDEAIHRYGLKAEQIVFEVVETERIDDYDHLNYILDYYKDKGYATALDDVGSGYASTGALLRLNPSYMKIDMGIIRGIHENKQNQRILNEYLSIAREKNIYILAEGVETKEEIDYLTEAKVDFLQGYYFGKPSHKPL